MTFDWDDRKAVANLRKHGVSFELAVEVWKDARRLVVFDRIEGGEERWHAIGLVRGVVVLTVVHVGDEDERIRVISARKATREERRRYEAGNE